MKQIFCVEEDSEVMSSLARIRIISQPLSLFSAHNSFSVDPTRKSLNICMGKSAGVISNSLVSSSTFLPEILVGADQKSVSVDLRCENTEVMPPGKLYSLMSMPREFIEPSYRRADKQ